MPTWDDVQYMKFVDARTRPAAELLARVPLVDAQYIVDLGCGPGNSTQLLRARWSSARIVGVDSSAEMLRTARPALPDCEWVQSDLRDFRPAQPVDVLFANAVLHWLPDHSQLVPQLLAFLRPGGALAVQMPNNSQEPSHRLMRELAQHELTASALTATPRGSEHVSSPSAYYDLLAAHARSVDIWQTRYEHVMPDAAAIVEWVKGSGLRPYLEALPAERREGFLSDYERAIASAYPTRADGLRLFSFPRMFMVAVR
jgi:trans-aconitate 2-methyltransferase